MVTSYGNGRCCIATLASTRWTRPCGETLYLDNWKRSVCGYRILTSPTEMTAAEDAYDYAAATELARAASRAEGRALVVYMYDAENWH